MLLLVRNMIHLLTNLQVNGKIELIKITLRFQWKTFQRLGICFRLSQICLKMCILSRIFLYLPIHRPSSIGETVIQHPKIYIMLSGNVRMLNFPLFFNVNICMSVSNFASDSLSFTTVACFLFSCQQDFNTSVCVHLNVNKYVFVCLCIANVFLSNYVAICKFGF